MGCHFPFQGIFPTPGSNPSLSYCRQILYRLSEPPGKPPSKINVSLQVWPRVHNSPAHSWCRPQRPPSPRPLRSHEHKVAPTVVSGPEVYTQNWKSELEPMTQLPSKQISLDEPCVLFKPVRKAFILRKAVDALPPESRPCLLLCSKPQSRPAGLRKQRVSGRPLSSRDAVTRDLALQGLDLKFRWEKGELCVMS